MISTKKLIKMARKWQSLNIKRRQQVKKGHFVIYTTDERRFALPLAYLESEIVRELLRMAEEFGLMGDGPITLPCDSVFMEYAIAMIQKSVTREMEEALILSLSNGCRSYSALSSSTNLCCGVQLPISCC